MTRNYAHDRLRDNDEEDHDEQPPNAASAAAAVAALQAELGLADGDLNAGGANDDGAAPFDCQ
ncbi:MAG: hypothetical protein ACR2H0_07980 [Candidatus Limnocylindrales bacterium]